MKVLIVLSGVVALSVTKTGYLGAGIAASGAFASPGIVGAHDIGYVAAPAVTVARAVPAADAFPDGLALTTNDVPVDTPAVQAGHIANAIVHASANSLTVATAAARGAYYGAPVLGYAAGIVGAPAQGYVGHGLVGARALGYAAGIVGVPALGYGGHGIVGAPTLVYSAGNVGAPALGYVGHGIVGAPTLEDAACLGYAGHGIVVAPTLGYAAGIVGAPALGYADHSVVVAPALEDAACLGHAEHGVVAASTVDFDSAPADVVPAAAGLALTPHGVPVDTPVV